MQLKLGNPHSDAGKKLIGKMSAARMTYEVVKKAHNFPTFSKNLLSLGLKKAPGQM